MFLFSYGFIPWNMLYLNRRPLGRVILPTISRPVFVDDPRNFISEEERFSRGF